LIVEIQVAMYLMRRDDFLLEKKKGNLRYFSACKLNLLSYTHIYTYTDRERGGEREREVEMFYSSTGTPESR